jgi:hypothetical protein
VEAGGLQVQGQPELYSKPLSQKNKQKKKEEEEEKKGGGTIPTLANLWGCYENKSDMQIKKALN